ncbi:zinc ribbon domain-containing protein [Pirellulaceae bacterium SH467]
MPIRVTCQCGQSLSVPDEMAGKSGRCPKCKGVLKVPASQGNPVAASTTGAAAPKATSEATPKTSAKTSAAGSASPAPNSNLAGLFDDVGLVTKTGKMCPSCDSPLDPRAVLCIHCGLNLAEGKKLDGFQAKAQKKFGNKHLNEAAEMMEREQATEKRLLGAGAPWWMMFSILAGIVIFIAGLAIKMDAATSGKTSSIELLRRIQSATYLTVMSGSFGAAMVAISIFASLAILITAFKESAKQGLLSMFVPFYILYYMFSRLFTKNLVTTVIIYWVSSLLGGILLGYAMPRI